jgi:hypothetical protein
LEAAVYLHPFEIELDGFLDPFEAACEFIFRLPYEDPVQLSDHVDGIDGFNLP